MLLVDKPPGWTSHDAVERLRKVPGFHKTGHAGTLDPMATGLLVVCVNEATKIARFLMEGDKEYLATVRLGVVTDTQDVTGRVLREGEWRGVTREAVERAMGAFLGTIDQVPPMYSALKREGVRLHELARADQEVERAPRQIEVRAIILERFAPPEFLIRVTCSKGTYVRTLAADLGEALGCGATLAGLRRIRSGTFSVEEALSPDALIVSEGEQALARLMAPADALPGFRPLTVDGDALERARHGQMPDAPADLVSGASVKVMDPAGRLVALAESVAERSGQIRLRALRVFQGDESTDLKDSSKQE